MLCCFFGAGKDCRTTTAFTTLALSFVDGDIYCSVQLADLAVKLIQGAEGALGVDRQRLGLQILIDLIQVLIDPTQLLFQRVELGLAGDADADVS